MNAEVKQAEYYIHSHLWTELTLSEVAGAVDSNAADLNYQFKKQTGLSLYEYIMLQRMDAAKQCLFSTGNMAKMAVG